MALEDGSGPRASSPRCQTSPSEHRRNQLRTFPKPALKCGPARVEGPLRRAQTPWPWRTDRARGPAAHGAKRHLLNTVETSFEPSLNPALKCGTPSQGPNTMALEDGSGPRASSPREHRRNQLRTFPKPAHEVRPGAGRGTPSHGPNTMALEDGSGPRASSPRCQTSPSEHRRNQLRTFPKPALKCGPARVEGPLRRAQTPWPWRTDRARGPAAHGAKRHLLNTVETSFEPSLNQPMKCGPARVEGPLRRAQTPWPWRTDRARGPAAHGAKRHLPKRSG